ncbi:PepSY-associated TM helix domain-containing protein [Hirschia baltica]|uniref:PepSY-associated TM helix domain-containing protein n=1 Tax=Hirschia baltica (strain ATCC 49814 / DSM 5838 / IFAM 1418) TaxID=582402 RepID=C6XLS8_HIRBI|nr:PepSY-associated TM helix domain-containing protein [Hirschia baltica]ACT57984.1 PepSY-associated TM helix domain-containing protein [Hirschia baltica ATCC 49814]
MSKSIWPKASSGRVASSLQAHMVLALAAGGLIYILAITGTLSVLNREFQRWEQPSAPEMTQISPEAAAKAAKAVFESETPSTTHLYINFPRPDLPRTVISTDTQAFFATETGEVGEAENFPWTQFLLDLHYYLHLPHILGLTVVGALGAILLGLSLSGFLAHPRIFRDAFTFRRGESRIAKADLHNRLSVWTAPFHISNALTGAILGLASVLAFAIAAVDFEGDTTKVFSPIFGEEAPMDETSSNISDIAKPIAYVQENYPDLTPTYYIHHDPGTAGQHISVIGWHSNRLIFGEYYNFNSNGEFEGVTGMSNGTLGQQIAGSIYNVHFGNWGGTWVKIAYVIFGAALSIITATGLRIYFARRRDQGRPAPILESMWSGLVWGTPSILAVCLVFSLALGWEGSSLVSTFWLGLCAIISVAGFRPSIDWSRLLQMSLTFSLVLIVVIHALTNSAHIMSAASWPISGAIIAIAILVGLKSFSKPKHSVPV